MATIDAQVETNLEPLRIAAELIMSIPGIKNLSAHITVSEIGIDMSSLRPHSSSSYVRAMTRAPENVDPIVSARELIGLRPRCGFAAAKNKGSYLQARSSASKPGAVPSRRSWLSSLPC